MAGGVKRAGDFFAGDCERGGDFEHGVEVLVRLVDDRPMSGVERIDVRKLEQVALPRLVVEIHARVDA